MSNIAKRADRPALFLGRPDDGDDHDLVLLSVWRDLEALRPFIGDEWREARLLPEEAELSQSASVSQVLVDTAVGPGPGMVRGGPA